MAASLTLLLGFHRIYWHELGIQSTLGVQEGFNPANLYLISLDPGSAMATPPTVPRISSRNSWIA